MIEGQPVDAILAALEQDLGGPVPEHLRFLAHYAPGSLQGYYRLWQELMREPAQGGALPRRYKALINVGLTMASRNRDAAVFWSRIGTRWGLQFEELRESVCFHITGQGMSTFLDIGHACLAGALDEAAKLGGIPASEALAPFVTPEPWKRVALPTNDLPLAERPAQVEPGNATEAAIHAYFEKSFNAPMPEFWAHLGRESSGILEGYYLLRKDNMRRPEEGGATPKKIKELVAVAVDTVLHNPWGGEAHLRTAMVNGATVADVREIEGLVIMETGMVNYKMTGFDFLVRAEEFAAALAQAS